MWLLRDRGRQRHYKYGKVALDDCLSPFLPIPLLNWIVMSRCGQVGIGSKTVKGFMISKHRGRRDAWKVKVLEAPALDMDYVVFSQPCLTRWMSTTMCRNCYDERGISFSVESSWTTTPIKNVYRIFFLSEHIRMIASLSSSSDQTSLIWFKCNEVTTTCIMLERLASTTRCPLWNTRSQIFKHLATAASRIPCLVRYSLCYFTHSCRSCFRCLFFLPIQL